MKLRELGLAWYIIGPIVGALVNGTIDDAKRHQPAPQPPPAVSAPAQPAPDKPHEQRDGA